MEELRKLQKPGCQVKVSNTKRRERPREKEENCSWEICGCISNGRGMVHPLDNWNPECKVKDEEKMAEEEEDTAEEEE
jgi:hypothetical protein